MKNFIFISDFDGTLSQKDFYHIVIDKYFKEWGTELFERWKRREMRDTEFLDTVFRSIDREEQDILEDILTIPMDKHAKNFIERVKAAGGDFVVLSAGTDYYIEKLFEHMGIKGVRIISNKGVYKDRGIHLVTDPGSNYYSEVYGVDKAKVVEMFKEEYLQVFFAGDSEPDLKAALAAHKAFATGYLQQLLKERNHPFEPFQSFGEIEDYLIKAGVIR